MDFTRKDLLTIGLEESGMYAAKILGGYRDDVKKIVNIKMELDGQYIDYLKFFMVKKNGEPNTYAYNQINELLTLAQIDNLTLDGNRYIELTNIEVGILVEIEEHKGYKNLNLISFFDLETQKNAFEKYHDLEAQHIDKEFEKLEKRYEQLQK